jgi:hypothetical protein
MKFIEMGWSVNLCATDQHSISYRNKEISSEVSEGRQIGRDAEVVMVYVKALSSMFLERRKP